MGTDHAPTITLGVDLGVVDGGPRLSVASDQSFERRNVASALPPVEQGVEDALGLERLEGVVAVDDEEAVDLRVVEDEGAAGGQEVIAPAPDARVLHQDDLEGCVCDECVTCE